MLISCGNDEAVSAPLRDLSDQTGIDIALQTRSERCRAYRLAVFDMDSTLIDCEVIDELASRGVGNKVSDITASAMRGELDFDESFRTRLACWRVLMPMRYALADRLPVRRGFVK